ncbi:response regulator [Paenibacillus daejeonensis]|uniref:response regulator n=1 Tax=Paenibacillus daejeonensis TaxID=135193 RepID=UPI000362190E|nr:response regulator [Paenibacillus daejeonensis]
MYKVIIVEDEMLVRIGLKNSVDWSRYGMEVIADLPDGQAAWELYERERPDVIITDIRMPRMDGMELIAHIRKQDKETRIIVLSCMEEFDLARKALALGVSNYIVKLTMTEEEIGGVLEEVAAELRQQERPATAEEQELSTANLTLLKEKMLKDFMYYGIFSSEEFGAFVKRHGLRLEPSRLTAVIMEMDRYPQLKAKFKDEQGHLIQMTLMNLLAELTQGHKRGEVFHLDEKHYLLLLSFGDLPSEQAIQQELQVVLHHIAATIRTYFNGSVSFGISGVLGGYRQLPKLYAQAQQALEGKFLTGIGQLHWPDRQPSAERVTDLLSELRMHEPLLRLLSPMKQQEYAHYIDSLEGGLEGPRKPLEIVLLQLTQWLGTALYDNVPGEKALLVSITEQLEQSDTLPDMLELISGYASELAEQSHSQLHMSGEITKAIQYIKQHYTQNISLQMVADHVNLSVSYLSNLFKKELQISFVDYLNRYRIERAKELLTGSQLKSYDIAVQVGFSPEYTYFSKVFKKVTGLGPNEYRRQWLSGTGSPR